MKLYYLLIRLLIYFLSSQLDCLLHNVKDHVYLLLYCQL